ncbi:unnamed protein product [Prorocentrum cordatum]|uniref:Pentatricopeptide repeat-containing protein n=1 Tax=Prorocentrum cordatum TaxID=2364126 RepID=A0ABN9TG85_9DINO|nr:unnamed protein product [Polarella glacialis]
MRDERLEPDVISFSAGIRACGKGEQWQRALALFGELWDSKMEPDVITYGTVISSCGKCEQWRLALALLGEMAAARVEPNVVYSATTPGPARVKNAHSGSRWCCCSATCWK